MDKRLELTEEQKLAIENYAKACRELKAANVKAVYRVDELYFLNGNNITDINFVDYVEQEDDNEEIVELDFDKLPCYDYPYDFAVGLHDEPSFAVKLQ